jgi:DNA polymerase IIIc chi subunit
MAYAKGTKVAIETTDQQIKTMLRKAGATAYATFEDGNGASIAFRLNDLNIRMALAMPDRFSNEFVMKTVNQYGGQAPRSEDAAEKLWEQACRERWRALHLCVKAKLEAIAAGVETFEDAFLAHVMTETGETVGERVRPQLAAIVKGNAPLQITGRTH